MTHNHPIAIALLISCLLAALVACDQPLYTSDPLPTEEVALILSLDEPTAVHETIVDLQRYLKRMGLNSVIVPIDPTQPWQWSKLELYGKKTVIVVSGDWLKDSMISVDTKKGLNGDSYVIKGTNRNGRLLIELWAPSKRPRLYSIYDLLRKMGLRFFHPEEEWVPEKATFPLAPFRFVEKPTYRWRGMHLHMTHPVELLDDFRTDDAPARRRARNFVLWLLKNRQNYSSGTWGNQTENMRDLGFVHSRGMGLTNIQQGGRPLLVPTDPLDVNLKKIEEALKKIFSDPNNIPQFFGISATDTEIFNSNATKEQILDWFRFATNWVHENYPQVYLLQNVHITKEEVIEELGVDVNLVHTLLPPYVNLQIHTVMFYGLRGPAPAYGHTTFEGRLKLFETELNKGRRMWYFPESAWWLTFDNAVPLFLPLYIKMRSQDLKDLEPMIPKGIDGHITFTTGHEWGYWMIDYCIMQMTWDHQQDWKQCLTRITGLMGPDGDEVQRVLVEMGDYQKQTLIDGDMHRWIVGEDKLAEVGAKTPKAAHRVRIEFDLLLSWASERISSFRKKELAEMLGMENTYKGYLDRLRRVEPTISKRARYLFDEVLDGTEINYLRARQIRLLYEGLLDVRQATLTGENSLLLAGKQKLAQAKGVTEDASKVIARREKQYRYPLHLSTEGSRDNPVPNRTSYPFRVHSDTHTLFFWHRRDRQAADTLEQLENKLVTIQDVLTPIGDPILVQVSPLIASGSTVFYGDGTSESTNSPKPHGYTKQGLYELAVTRDDQALVKDRVAVVGKRWRFRMRTLNITQPSEAESTALLLRGLLPDVFLGTGEFNALAHDADKNGHPDGQTVLPLIANGDDSFQPVNWTVKLLSGHITFYDMRLTLDQSGDEAILRFTGKLTRSELSHFIISFGGIDQFSVDGILNTIFLNPIVEDGETYYPIEAELRQ